MSKMILSYDHFKDEFEKYALEVDGEKSISHVNSGYLVLVKNGDDIIDVEYDLSTDEFLIYKQTGLKKRVMIESGINLKTAKLIMKVLK